MTAADATAELLAYWATLGIDPADIELPDFETANGVYLSSDQYVESSGFYLVQVGNATAAEYAAYIEDLETAGWNLEYFNNTESGLTGYACTFGESGTVPCMEVQDHLDAGYVAILAYSTFIMGEITPQSVIANIASMVTQTGEYDDLGNNTYALEAGYLASSVSLDKIIGWIETAFVPEGFTMVEDWTPDVYEGIAAQTRTYYNEDADVVLEFKIFSWSHPTAGDINSFYAKAYYGN